MGFDFDKKVEKISVSEILEYNNKVYLEDVARAQALIELTCFIKGIGSKDAYKLKGYVLIMKSLNCPYISMNLCKYIQSRPSYALKKDIDKIIIENHGGDYSSFKFHENWKVLQRGWFSCFYYYSEKNYVNVFTIPEGDLPLYINHPFDKDAKKVYLDRMRGKLL